MEILKVENLNKIYGKGENEVKAVNDISFSVEKGEFVAIVGASGSGKSTLLHLLGGVDRPTSGKVFIDGQDIYKLNDDQLAIFRRRQVGLIYQFYNLIPILNVEENITLPCNLDGKEVKRERLDEVLRTLKLENRSKHLPNELSGGQQQRVSIGRAIINNPSIMLADEPTGNLDSKASEEIISLLRLSNKKYNQTVIVITHDEKIALEADRVITIDDGRYIEYISAEAKDFEVYSSYTEELNLSTERQMATSFLNMVAPINNNVYVFFPISALLTLLLIIYLTSAIGYDGNEDSTININTFDRIPIEIIAFCAMLISCMPFILLEFAENDYNAINSIAITAYFIIYICTVITMTTVIKRIKARQFAKTSITGKVLLWCLKICKKIINKIKEIWNTITYSPNTTAKVIITTGLTVFVWLIIIAISGNGPMFPIIMIVLIGFVLYKIIKIFKEYLQIEKKLKDIYEGNTQSNLDEKSVENIFKNSVIYLNDISNGFENAVQDRMKSERMKAELITNVSHDIKTPLTSIINYVDLLKQENIQDEKAREYIGILENKSQRLKRLTEDLVEASKVSTGNIYLNLEKINIVELIKQATGEFEDKFKRRELEPIINADQNEINIMADSKYMYRIIENLYSNISKYALENSRVYVDIKMSKTEPVPNVQIEIKNISKDKLNISADELMQRFVRGEKSRTTEGSGLGISIAQNLTELQNGKFELKLDGDLFKVELTFNII